MAMDQKLDLLERVPLFADVPRKVLEHIGLFVDEIEVPAGKALTHEGRHEGYFFVIEEGTIRIDQGGQTINTIGPGDYLGEIALLDGGPRTATATTETPCRLLSLTNERFWELVESSAAVRTAIIQSVGQRLRALDEDSVI